jgi:hypothetical protein
MADNKSKIPETERKALLALKDHYEEKDRETHEALAKDTAKYDRYWRGMQDLVWDPIGKEWVSAAGVLRSSLSKAEFEDVSLEKVVNIYKSYGESVISALANTTPATRFFPENAEDPADIATSKAYINLADKICRDNDSDLLFVKALFTMWNQHFVASYNTHAWDEKFGTLSHNTIEMVETPTQKAMCPDCQQEYPPEVPPQPPCPNCGSETPPEPFEGMEEVPEITKTITTPKGQEIIEVYGPRNVKVPPYIAELEESPYIILENEINGAYLAELYPDYFKELVEEDADTHEVGRQEREPIAQFGQMLEVKTLKRCWFRPWSFNVLKKEEKAALKKKYPEGVVAFIVEDHILEAFEEDMDDHWTFVPDPLSHEIHGDPMAKPLVPIQDMVNDLESLGYETILAGVPEIFADTKVLNFKEYSKIEARPNQVIPASAMEGVGLSGGFFQPHSANLSKEAAEFRQSQDQNAQFLTGAFPSIYGGQLKGDRTLGEYQQSRAQALQRLSLKWKFLNKWWAKTILKACESYRTNMEIDENFVKQEGDGYANVWIRASEMTGRVADVYPEASDQFPMTWEQTRGVIMELLQIQDPYVTSVLQSPENVDEFSKIFSLSKFKVPGAEQRYKQTYEIAKLKQGQPVQVDPLLDDHEQHLMMLMSWAAGPEGREAQETNPPLYQAIMMHAQEHDMILQEQQAQMEEEQVAGGGDQPAEGDVATETGGAAVPPSDDTGTE